MERNKIEFGVCESNSQKNLGANCSKSQIYARQSTSFTYSDDSNRFCILTPPLHDLLQLLQEPQLAQDAAIGPGYQIETLPQRNPGIVFLAQDFKVS